MCMHYYVVVTFVAYKNTNRKKQKRCGLYNVSGIARQTISILYFLLPPKLVVPSVLATLLS